MPFQLLWTNTFTFGLIQSTQRFTFVWLVLDLNAGAHGVGLISFALGIPVFFLVIPSGVLADRMNRRTLVMGSQLGAVAVTFTIALVLFGGGMTVPIAYLLAAGMGATVALGMPARNAIIPTIVGRDRLMNAVVLMSLGQNLSQIIGPVLGGVAIYLWGIEGAFVAQGGILLLGALMLLPLKVPPPDRQAAAGRALGDFREGLVFIWRTPGIRTLVILLFVSGILMSGPFMALLPKILRDDLGASAFETSLVFACMGGGMMMTSLVLARASNLKNKGGWFTGSLVMGGVMLALIGNSPWYFVTASLMFVGGMAGGLHMNLNQTLLQTNTPPAIMGRVMSIHMLNMMGVGPIGSLFAGFAAAAVGAGEWMAISGAVLSSIALYVLITQANLRRMA